MSRPVQHICWLPLIVTRSRLLMVCACYRNVSVTKTNSRVYRYVVDVTAANNAKKRNWNQQRKKKATSGAVIVCKVSMELFSSFYWVSNENRILHTHEILRSCNHNINRISRHKRTKISANFNTSKRNRQVQHVLVSEYSWSYFGSILSRGKNNYSDCFVLTSPRFTTDKHHSDYSRNACRCEKAVTMSIAPSLCRSQHFQ